MTRRYSDSTETLTRDDLLNRYSLAQKICHAACAMTDSDEPRVIGLFGPWGSGKSRMLRLIGYSALVDAVGQEHVVAAFPAWRYQLDGDIATAFVAALSSRKNYPTLPDRGEVQVIHNEAQWSRIREVCRKVLKLLSSGLATAGLVPSGTESIITSLSDSIPNESFDGYDAIQEVVQDLVEKIMDGRAGRLLILVDDLDRCSPDAMVRLFEWMKLHFCSPRCSFVVALDHRAAARAIVGRYRDYVADPRDSAFGYRYLDKLFDEHFELRASARVTSMAVTTGLQRRARRMPQNSEITFSGDRPFASLARIVLERDFPWQNRLDAIVSMRCIGEPRVMLRVADVYCDVLEQLAKHSVHEDPMRLPRESPFWALLLISMQFTLTPEVLDNFAYRQGPLAFAATEARIHREIQDLSGESPVREIADLLVTLAAQEPLTMPRRDELLHLLHLVRQRIFQA